MTPEPRAYLQKELISLSSLSLTMSARTVMGQPPAALAECLISYKTWPHGGTAKGKRNGSQVHHALPPDR